MKEMINKDERFVIDLDETSTDAENIVGGLSSLAKKKQRRVY